MEKANLVCEHCGNDKEFYTRERYSGTCNVFFRTDEMEAAIKQYEETEM